MFDIYQKIINDFKDKDEYVILIDGYAGSGKTTLARILKDQLNATLIHIDDFYLPIAKRKEDWFEKAGGNIDFDRLNNEIILPYKNKQPLMFNKFNPKLQQLEIISLKPYNSKLIVEGSYSMHPNIKLDYSYKIFMKCNKNKQKDRLIIREKDNYINFENTWIVKELNYQKEFNIEENSNIVIDTSNLF